MKKKGVNSSYWGSVLEGLSTSWQGLKLSFKHLREAKNSREPIGIENPQYFQQKTGIVTLQYPFQQIPVPDNGRYQLHNEMDDCIVCDKCVKICPVNCIEIEPIKAVSEIGKTSDGTTKRLYAARFDIDMAKCCFCGLCTVVCPTECLTMTPNYDVSVFDVKQLNLPFATLTPEEANQKREEYDIFQAQKAAAKTATAVPTASTSTEAVAPTEKKPFRPVIKKKTEITAEETTPIPEITVDASNTTIEPTTPETAPPATKKPFKPIIKRKMEETEPAKAEENISEEVKNTVEPPSVTETPETAPSAAKKPFKPIMKRKTEETEPAKAEENISEEVKNTDEPPSVTETPETAPSAAKKPFKPIMKRKTEETEPAKAEENISEEVKNIVEPPSVTETPETAPSAVKKPFKPIMRRPKPEDNAGNQTNE